MARPVYLYAIARATAELDMEFEPVGPDGAAPAYAIECGPLSVVAAPAAFDEAPTTERCLRAHARALERLSAGADVLPLRFGLIADGAAGVRATVDAARETLLDALHALAGRIEIGVRIHWERTRALREIDAGAPEIAAAYRDLAAKPEAETLEDRVKLARRVGALLEALALPERLGLIARLRGVAERVALGSPEDPMTLLKADLLVARAQQPALIRTLEAIASENAGRYAVRAVGPGPAYSFAELDLPWTPAAAAPAFAAGTPSAAAGRA